MKLRNLENILEDNKIVVIKMYDLIDEITTPIVFEFNDGCFKTVIADTEYELISLLGDCDIESIYPCIFDNKLCLNITINAKLEDSEKILSSLGFINH